jgi:hypothetical protein
MKDKQTSICAAIPFLMKKLIILNSNVHRPKNHNIITHDLLNSLQKLPV